jgi:hypothetical protein
MGSPSNYYTPDSMPLVYCSACLDIALDKSKKAKEIYDRIVRSYQEPAMRSILDEIQSSLPPRSKSFSIFKHEMKKEAKAEGSNRQLGRNFFGDLSRRLAVKSFGRLGLFLRLRKAQKIRELRRWAGMIDRLIIIGFNRKSVLWITRHKITIKNSPNLMQAIQLKTFADYLGLEVREGNGKTELKIGGNYQDLSRLILGLNKNSRLQRAFTKGYRQRQYTFVHDDKLAKVADRWYDCRVLFSGIKEYCDYLAVEKGEVLEPANMSKEIELCDIKMGYPRTKH